MPRHEVLGGVPRHHLERGTNSRGPLGLQAASAQYKGSQAQAFSCGLTQCLAQYLPALGPNTCIV